MIVTTQFSILGATPPAWWPWPSEQERRAQHAALDQKISEMTRLVQESTGAREGGTLRARRNTPLSAAAIYAARSRAARPVTNELPERRAAICASGCTRSLDGLEVCGDACAALEEPRARALMNLTTHRERRTR